MSPISQRREYLFRGELLELTYLYLARIQTEDGEKNENDYRLPYGNRIYNQL